MSSDIKLIDSPNGDEVIIEVDGRTIRIQGGNLVSADGQLVFHCDRIILEGQWTEMRMHDLVLDHPGRRLFKGGSRRALVHDPVDRLRINYEGDYPNGVYIEGITLVDSIHAIGNASFEGIETPAIFVTKTYPPKIKKPDDGPGGSGKSGWDLIKAVRDLWTEITDLKEKVARLESS